MTYPGSLSDVSLRCEKTVNQSRPSLDNSTSQLRNAERLNDKNTNLSCMNKTIKVIYNLIQCRYANLDLLCTTMDNKSHYN